MTCATYAYICMFCLATVSVSFNQSQYVVYEENGEVWPTLILSCPSSTKISVKVIDVYIDKAKSELHNIMCCTVCDTLIKSVRQNTFAMINFMYRIAEWVYVRASNFCEISDLA